MKQGRRSISVPVKTLWLMQLSSLFQAPPSRFLVSRELLNGLQLEEPEGGDIKVVPVSLPEGGDADEGWCRELSFVVNGGGTPVLSALGIKRSDLHLLVSGRDTLGGHKVRLHGSEALVYSAVRDLEQGRALGCLIPTPLLTSGATAQFRKLLAENGALRSIIWLGESAARLLGVHHQFQMALLVFEPFDDESRGAPRLLRLLDLRELPPKDWHSIIERAGRMKGGEADKVIVLRDPSLGDDVWTFERFSKAHRETLEDASSLGDLRPLAELTSVLDSGINIIQYSRAFVDPTEDGGFPTGCIPCYSARNIEKNGNLALPHLALLLEAVPLKSLLVEGDVLVRAIRSSGQALTMSVVGKEHLPATFSGHVIRLRWKHDVIREAHELLVAFLGSDHVKEWIQSQGDPITLTRALVGKIPVPDPAPDVLAAFEGLSRARTRPGSGCSCRFRGLEPRRAAVSALGRRDFGGPGTPLCRWQFPRDCSGDH